MKEGNRVLSPKHREWGVCGLRIDRIGATGFSCWQWGTGKGRVQGMKSRVSGLGLRVIRLGNSNLEFAQWPQEYSGFRG